MMKRTHSKLISDFIKFCDELRKNGKPVYMARTPTGLFRSFSGNRVIDARHKGHSDCSGVVNGVAVYAEAKSGKDSQSVDQKEFQKAVEMAGAVYFIYRDLETARSKVQEVLNELQ